MKRSIALLSMLVIAAALLVLGCTGSNNSGSPTATPAPSAISGTSTPAALPSALPSVAPAVNASVSDATTNISAGINATNSTYIDPSIADITNETDESVPNLG